MIKRLVITTLAMMLLLIGVGGCDLLEKVNYVTVIVDAQVCVKARDLEGSVAPIEAALVHITIDKAGGENVQYDEITDAEGCTVHVQGTFNVYKEQFVRVKAQIINAPMPDFMGGGSLDPDRHTIFNDSESLLWSKISKTEMGGTRNWYPTVEVIIEPKLN